MRVFPVNSPIRCGDGIGMREISFPSRLSSGEEEEKPRVVAFLC